VAQPSRHRWIRFLGEVRDELAKVIWPRRREVITYSIVVLVTVLVLGLFVFGLDVLFSKVVVGLFDE
jgi:preprotein translocase subunit SecE